MINTKLGYYSVNNFIFDKKIEAVLVANKTLADLQWNFNDEIFDRYDWTTEPSMSLLDIYKARAQQIRDQYDYVIVMVSGGADSTNVLYSFLKNGIHIDEVIAAAPLSGLNNWEWNNKDLSAENMISETKFAQLPLLDEIKTHWPNVKITIHDYFEDMVNYKTDEWAYKASSHLNLSVAKHSLDKFSHIKNLAESGKKIAKIYGIDKPWICRSENGTLYSAIVDQVVQVPQYESTKENHHNIETVLFYYTPDMPELIIKQSHMLSKWLYLPENINSRKTMWDLSTPVEYQMNPKRFSFHHRETVKCIYPMLDGWNVFQTNKGFTGLTFIEFDRWFLKLHKNTKLTQLLESDSNNLIKNINPKYFDFSKMIFKRLVKYRRIGHETELFPNIDFNISKELIKNSYLEDISKIIR